ncbi:hypothetical protein [uncultured Sharpea sp.]|uniref:hypothetical protein n=1 Tax=uncultured Sharpea sp. TaxID=1112738 RepID=UPI00258D7816|nr:hypothetical protein [uncultured Sharpea sp.]
MSLKTLAFLTILFTFVMSVVSYAAHDPISITILHVSLMLIAGLFLLFITHYKKNSHQLIIAEIHIFCALLLFYAIILSTYLNPDHPKAYGSFRIIELEVIQVIILVFYFI